MLLALWMKVSIISPLESLWGPLNGPSCSQFFGEWFLKNLSLTTSLSHVRSSTVFPVEVLRDEFLPPLHLTLGSTDPVTWHCFISLNPLSSLQPLGLCAALPSTRNTLPTVLDLVATSHSLVPRDEIPDHWGSNGLSYIFVTFLLLFYAFITVSYFVYL